MKYYLTTAIPYVNGKPHIGHALEYFQADTIRRCHNLLGDDTLLLSGADENALKNVQAAENENIPIDNYLDKYSKVWQDAFDKLGVKLDVFQRGSDQEKHWPGVQKLWELCDKNGNGDIYKKKYCGLYCTGCESFKTIKELVDGLCPIHQTKPDQIEEENYFFKLSNYQQKLIDLIESNTLIITPSNKRAEALSFIKSGLEDFSISRSLARSQGVGVPVPGDNEQRIYVWFDALNIYMTGVGFGWDENMFKKWWPANLHIIGKDINRFHTVYWPAMLLSAGIEIPKEIFIHGFVNVNGGEKMSKSLGNVIDPFELIEKYGLEPVRYFLLSQIPYNGDGDFSISRFEEVYNSDLANGLGNLIARVAKLAEKIHFSSNTGPHKLDTKMTKFLDQFKLNEALNHIWEEVAEADKYVSQEKPWELNIEDTLEVEKYAQIISQLINKIIHIGFNLQPFLPETSEKILKQFSGKVKSTSPLFPRI